MHVRAHVRSKIGLAAVAVATALAAGPTTSADPGTTRPAGATPNTTSKRPHALPRFVRAVGWKRPARRTAAEIVLARARGQLGKPYVWGGTGPRGFDCSGLTQFAWAGAGVGLPHNAAAQFAAVRRIPLEQARPGDLVFAGSGGIGHVGIYIGGGRMIHAPRSGRRIEVAPLHDNTVGAGRPAR